MALVRTLLHLLESYATLALYSMFLLCILLWSIRSMFSLYVGGEGQCMTVYVVHVSIAKGKIDAWLFSESIQLCAENCAGNSFFTYCSTLVLSV